MRQAAVSGPAPSIVVSSFAHFMFFELPFDVAREILQPAAQHIKILTKVLDPQSVGLGVMAPDFSAASIKVRASSRCRASLRSSVRARGALQMGGARRFGPPRPANRSALTG